MIKTVQMIECDEWDALVEKTYGKPYCFQQQDGCKDRGTYHLTVPSGGGYGFENTTIPDKVNGREMGVSFKAWLARDTHEWNGEEPLNSWTLELFWNRNFYPAIEEVADDLHVKGLLPTGKYIINIDW